MMAGETSGWGDGNGISHCVFTHSAKIARQNGSYAVIVRRIETAG
jgi:hypothetical protein